MENNNIRLSNDFSYSITMLIITLLSIIIFFNIIGILINYHIIKREIEEIEDKELKVDLLHSLNNIRSIIVKGFIYHNEQTLFLDKTCYNKYLNYKRSQRVFSRYTYPK